MWLSTTCHGYRSGHGLECSAIRDASQRCRRPATQPAGGTAGKTVNGIQKWTVALLLAFCAACSATAPSTEIKASFLFTQDTAEWQAGVADYSPGMLPTLQFVSGVQPLRAPLDTSEAALYLSSRNASDDAFMFYKHRYAGLIPGTRYIARFTAQIASDVPSGCAGIGGQPGEGVFVKAGASSAEPVAVDTGRYVMMNIDKGNQSQSGTNGVVIGNIATALQCDDTDSHRWQLKDLANSGESVSVQVPDDGFVWLFIGTDSGFEGTTEVFFTRFDVSFTPATGAHGS